MFFLGLGLLGVLLTCNDFVDFGALGSVWYDPFQVSQPLKLPGKKKTCTNLHIQESNQRTVHATSMLGDLDGASDGDIGTPFVLSLRKPHRVTARKGVYDFNATLSKQWLLQNLPLNFLQQAGLIKYLQALWLYARRSFKSLCINPLGHLDSFFWSVYVCREVPDPMNPRARSPRAGCSVGPLVHSTRVVSKPGMLRPLVAKMAHLGQYVYTYICTIYYIHSFIYWFMYKSCLSLFSVMFSKYQWYLQRKLDIGGKQQKSTKHPIDRKDSRVTCVNSLDDPSYRELGWCNSSQGEPKNPGFKNSRPRPSCWIFRNLLRSIFSIFLNIKLLGFFVGKVFCKASRKSPRLEPSFSSPTQPYTSVPSPRGEDVAESWAALAPGKRLVATHSTNTKNLTAVNQLPTSCRFPE